MSEPTRRRLGVVLYPVFELLDVFGPLEMFGSLPEQIEITVIAKLFGTKTSEDIALATEYEWHRDAGWDPFARAHGLV
jgi:hypothetical protein